ncbi:hypothetical protein AVEN_54110-1 [Araneus ventricosus]|uniref:Uncharacterized protein n=1 Tax=Araneus ventricosus TaxID=182803 RepID=A0A4Y2BU98_ARAVE|nr:hypothetical protein AVEN_54110-1 [Araneus ventricosus]
MILSLENEEYKKGERREALESSSHHLGNQYKGIPLEAQPALNPTAIRDVEAEDSCGKTSAMTDAASIVSIFNDSFDCIFNHLYVIAIFLCL